MQPLHLISKYLICYGLFFLLTYITKLNDGLKLIDEKGLVRNPGILIGLHIAGILWLGIIPINILNSSFQSIVFGNSFPGIWQWTVLFSLLLITTSFTFTQAKKFTIIHSTGNVSAAFRGSYLTKYFTFRILFLVFYEIWFRGYLLTDSIVSFGIPLAIALNTFLYTLLHIFGNRKEMIACIPFGAMMCCLCTWFGAAWPAIVIHCAIAMVYEINLVKKFTEPLKVVA